MITKVGRYLVAMAAMLAFCSTTYASLVLVDEGEAKAVIVVAAQPTRSAQVAANELQTHLQLISGAELPIVRADESLPADMTAIHVGESRRTREMGLLSYRFAPQHWLVRIDTDHIVLMGRDDPDTGDIDYERLGTWEGFDADRPFHRLGTLYAVYDFLEQFCDVRWYMITDLGRVTPERQTLALDPAEHHGNTWTTYRRLGQATWGQPGDLGEVDLRGIRRYQQWTSRRDTNLHVLRSRLAGEPFGVNHSVHDYYRRFGKTHPEWFVDSNPAPMTQLRYQSSEVVEQVADDAKAYFALPYTQRRHGVNLTHAASRAAGDFFPVVPLDNRNYSRAADPPAQPDRHGPSGSRGTGVHSNYIFTWVNRVAERVGEVYSEGWISTIAYAGMFQPPDFDMAANVAVMVCMEDGWADDSYGMEMLRQWRQRVTRLYTWEYHYASHRFPAIRPRRVAAYITHLRKMGVEGMFMEKGDRNPAVYHLDHYVESRLLTDANADVESLLSEYFDLFYGPAAEPMAQFWNTMEQMYEHSRHADQLQSWVVAAQDGRLEMLRHSLAEAKEAVGPRQPYAERLEVMQTAVLGMIESQLAQAEQSLDLGTPKVRIPRLNAPPQIDGRLDDAEWAEAARTPEFVTMMNGEVGVQTYAKLGHDDTHLYIAFRCEEPRVEHMRLDQRSASSAICTDESIEVNLDMSPDTDDYVQIMVSAQGFAWSWWRHKYRPQNSPDLELQTATHIGDGEWTVEVAVPWKSIVSAPPESGEQWRLNVMRNRYAMEGQQRFDERVWTCWSPPFSWSWHVQNRFGRATFD